MGRILKWGLAGLLGLVLLVGLGIFLIVTLVDLNSLKPRIESLAKEQANIDLRIPGNLSWSFYPYLGIELGETQVRPLATPEAPPLASIQKVAAGIAVMPLLSGEIKIQRIHLIQPEIHLHRNSQGVANWELIQEGLAKAADEDSTETDSEAPKKEQPEQASETADSSLALNLAIADVWLASAAVHIQDEIENLDLQLTDVSLRAKDVSLDKAFPIALTAKLNLAEPAANLDLNLTTNVQLNLAAKHYSLDKLKVKLIAAYPEMLNSPMTLTLDGKLDAQMASGEVRLPLALTLSAPNWADADLPEIAATQLVVDANLGLNKQFYLLNKLQLDTSLRLDKKQKMLPLSLKVTGEADLDKQLATLNQQLSLNELQQSLNIKATELLEELKFTGALNIEVIQLRKLLTDLGIELAEMADNTTLSQLAANLGFTGNLQETKVNQLDLAFDATEFKGHAQVNLETLAIYLRLAGNQLDADRYLPPPLTDEEAEAKAGTHKEVAANEDAELLPVELLKELNLDLGLTLGKLKVSDLTLEKLDLALIAKDGLVHLTKANLDLYQGTLRNKAQVDLRKDPAELSLTSHLKGLNLRPLLDDLKQESIPFRGTLNVAGDFTTQGTRLSEWLAHSNGEGSLRMHEGAVTGINLTKEVCEAAASIDGQTSSKQWSKDTEFTHLLADINLVKGQLNNPDLKLAIPGFEVSGYGFYHLVAEDFLYNLGVRFSKDADQQSCPVSSTLAEIRWPVECKGSLAGESPDIKCRPDTKAVTSFISQKITEAAKERADEIKAQVKDEAKTKLDEQKNQLKEDARKKLRSLFQ